LRLRGLPPRKLALIAAAVLATGGAGGAYLLDLSPPLERDASAPRFHLRRAETPPEVVVVAIDDKTFSDLRRQWPFPRRLHAQVIRRLSADGSRAIAFQKFVTESVLRVAMMSS